MRHVEKLEDVDYREALLRKLAPPLGERRPAVAVLFVL